MCTPSSDWNPVETRHPEWLEKLLDHTETTLQREIPSLSDEQKIARIEKNVAQIMQTLGLDLNDQSLRETPRRVAKMYVLETFKGLNPKNKPTITLFDNDYRYREMLIEKDITLYSTCEHHLVPIIGKAHVAYFSAGQVIGLSKLNRLVDFHARQPQVQERLTIRIAEDIKSILNTPDVAVYIEADHLCVASRGIRDTSSNTVTSHYTGRFLDKDTRAEFLAAIRSR